MTYWAMKIPCCVTSYGVRVWRDCYAARLVCVSQLATRVANGVGIAIEGGKINSRLGLPAFFAMLGHDVGEDAATYIKLGGELHIAGLGGFDQIIQNLVGHGLVEAAFVTEAPHVHFEAFELNTLFVWNVVQKQGGKVWLAGFGAQAGKFRNLHVNMKITLRGRIGKGFELFTGLARHIWGFLRAFQRGCGDVASG